MLQSPGRASTAEMEELLAETQRERLKLIESLLASCKLSDLEVEIQLVKGEVRETLPKFVDEHKVDLVVMGTVSRTGLQRLIVGNTAEKMMNSLNCSMLAVKPQGFVSPVAIDRSASEA